MDIEIEVTQDDIDKGTKKCISCPVARAVARKLSEYFGTEVFVQAQYAWIRWYKTYGKWYDTYTPKEVCLFMVEFDAGGRKVEPFKFTLRVDSLN